MQNAVIVDTLRTPLGKRNGRLKDWHPVDLAGVALRELVARTGIDPTQIDDVIMGCVMQVGEQSLNIARNAVLAAGWPESGPGTTVDRQCGSSQQAAHFAAQGVMAGAYDVVVAAGVEVMSRVPMGASLSDRTFGFPFGPRVQARYESVGGLVGQGISAEMIADKWSMTKDEIDRFAFESHRKAIAATQAGAFAREIVPVTVEAPEGPVEHTVDEGIRFDATLEGIAGVKLLKEGGKITAASSSQICDGASAALIVSETALKELGLIPRARIHTLTVTAGDPVIMLEEPLFATDKALARAGLSIGDIDLYEVNEAFAPVPMAWLKHTGADPERLNVNGGAIALGHPLGASGTKLMATLLNALHARGGKYGLQTMCEGGGVANVTIIEAV